jgi:hypothetical protein
MRLLGLMALVGLALLAAPAGAQGAFDRIGLAVRVDKGPLVDGYLDEPQWQQAERLIGFTLLVSPATLPEGQTVGRILYDQERIYVGVECFDRNLGLLVYEKRPRDAEIWADDSVEVHLDPHNEKANYYQVIVNPVGSFYDAIELDDTWDGAVKVKAQRLADRWTVEFSLTFACLDASTPREGSSWGFDLFRRQKSTGVTIKSAWSNTGRDDFDVPERYGTLVFGSYRRGATGLAAVVLRDLDLTEKELERAARAEGAEDLRGRIEALRERARQVMDAFETEPPPTREVTKERYQDAVALVGEADEAGWDVKFFVLLNALEEQTQEGQ